MIYIIPLDNIPQQFTIDLAGVTYIITCRWNPEGITWVLDIENEAGPLVLNLPLVTGVNLLEQHGHIIPGQLIAYTDGDEFTPPTLDNLGQAANLYYVI